MRKLNKKEINKESRKIYFFIYFSRIKRLYNKYNGDRLKWEK